MDTNYKSCSTWWLLWIHATCIIIQRINSSDDIYWKLFTKPAVFGDDVILECKLPERTCCHSFARRWLGGKDLRLLVMNGASVYPQKYTESFRPEFYSSKLTIHSLNSTDVNVSYACTYGFVKDVKVLELTEEHFESLPSEPLEANITTSTENMLLVNISMHQVFPKPNCTASLDASDISDFIKMSAVMTTTLFAVTITISYLMPLTSCLSCFHIVCRVGTKLLELHKNVTCENYNPKNDRESKALLIISLVLITSALAFICLMTYTLILQANIDRFEKGHDIPLVRFENRQRTRYRRPPETINTFERIVIA